MLKLESQVRLDLDKDQIADIQQILLIELNMGRMSGKHFGIVWDALENKWHRWSVASITDRGIMVAFDCVMLPTTFSEDDFILLP